TATTVALPERAGRIMTLPVTFKETGREGEAADEVIRYAADRGRVETVGRLALRFAALRRKANTEKRVAFILTNNAGKANRVGNAVGLDAPASLMELFGAMAEV